MSNSLFPVSLNINNYSKFSLQGRDLAALFVCAPASKEMIMSAFGLDNLIINHLPNVDLVNYDCMPLRNFAKFVEFIFDKKEKRIDPATLLSLPKNAEGYQKRFATHGIYCDQLSHKKIDCAYPSFLYKSNPIYLHYVGLSQSKKAVDCSRFLLDDKKIENLTRCISQNYDLAWQYYIEKSTRANFSEAFSRIKSDL